MNKSLIMRLSLFCLTALLGAGVVSARSAVASASGVTARPAAAQAFASVAIDAGVPVSASLLPIWFNSNGKSGDMHNDDRGGDGNHGGKGGDDKGDKNDDHAPAPVPEPSTILSLCVALVIGGGVYFLRRLRGERK